MTTTTTAAPATQPLRLLQPLLLLRIVPPRLLVLQLLLAMTTFTQSPPDFPSKLVIAPKTLKPRTSYLRYLISHLRPQNRLAQLTPAPHSSLFTPHTSPSDLALDTASFPLRTSDLPTSTSHPTSQHSSPIALLCTRHSSHLSPQPLLLTPLT